jgi:hypothetical protein
MTNNVVIDAQRINGKKSKKSSQQSCKCLAMSYIDTERGLELFHFDDRVPRPMLSNVVTIINKGLFLYSAHQRASSHVPSQQLLPYHLITVSRQTIATPLSGYVRVNDGAGHVIVSQSRQT